MRHQKPFPPDTVERLETLLKFSGSVEEYRRIQSIYFRAKYGYRAEQIADMLSLKTQTVRNLHSAYLKEGETSLGSSGKCVLSHLILLKRVSHGE